MNETSIEVKVGNNVSPSGVKRPIEIYGLGLPAQMFLLSVEQARELCGKIMHGLVTVALREAGGKIVLSPEEKVTLDQLYNEMKAIEVESKATGAGPVHIINKTNDEITNRKTI